jgi:hypothetical protein
MIMTWSHVSASNLLAGGQVSNPIKKIGHTKYHLENPKATWNGLVVPVWEGSAPWFSSSAP